VWNYPERIARFVEVKGPGDSLSETQKVSCCGNMRVLADIRFGSMSYYLQACLSKCAVSRTRPRSTAGRRPSARGR
jgi:hypothetical protein